MQTLEELQSAYARNAAAQQQIADLDRRQRQAAALRETPISNGLGAIGDVMSSIAGKKQYNQLEQQRAAPTQTMADTEALIKNEGLRRARQQDQLQADKWANTQERQQVSDQQRLEDIARQQANRKEDQGIQARQRAEEQARRAELDEYNYQLRSEKILAQKAKDEARQKHLDRQYDLQRDRLQAQINGSGRNEPYKADSGTFKKGVQEQLNEVKMVDDLYKSFNDNVTQINGLPTGMVNRFLHRRAGDDMLKFVDSAMGTNLDAPTKASLRWWGTYRKFVELGQQHELFGAQFTQSEQARWKEASLVQPGSDPDEVRAAVRDMQRIYTKHAKLRMRSLMAGARYGDKDTYTEMLKQSGWETDERGLPIVTQDEIDGSYLGDSETVNALTWDGYNSASDDDKAWWDSLSPQEQAIALGK